jgi:hypothetical protein
VIAGYRRLTDKYKKLEAKANALEHEKAEALEIHEVLKETQYYIDYRLSVQLGLHEIHEVLKALFGEVGACCLTFPARNAPFDDYIGWFEEEVNTVCRVVWQLNDNFVVLAI